MWGIRVKKRARALFRPSSANAPKTVLSFRVLCAREKKHNKSQGEERARLAARGKGFRGERDTLESKWRKGCTFSTQKKERKERAITLAHRRVKIFLSDITFGAKKTHGNLPRRGLFSLSPESVSLYPHREVKSFLFLYLEC